MRGPVPGCAWRMEPASQLNSRNRGSIFITLPPTERSSGAEEEDQQETPQPPCCRTIWALLAELRASLTSHRKLIVHFGLSRIECTVWPLGLVEKSLHSHFGDGLTFRRSEVACSKVSESVGQMRGLPNLPSREQPRLACLCSYPLSPRGFRPKTDPPRRLMHRQANRTRRPTLASLYQRSLPKGKRIRKLVRSTKKRRWLSTPYQLRRIIRRGIY